MDQDPSLFRELIIGIIILTSIILIYYAYDSRLAKTDSGARRLGILVFKFDDVYINEFAVILSIIGLLYLAVFGVPNPLVINGIIYSAIGFFLVTFSPENSMIKEVKIGNTTQTKYFLTQWNYFFLYSIAGISFIISGLITVNIS